MKTTNILLVAIFLIVFRVGGIQLFGFDQKSSMSILLSAVAYLGSMGFGLAGIVRVVKGQ